MGEVTGRTCDSIVHVCSGNWNDPGRSVRCGKPAVRVHGAHATCDDCDLVFIKRSEYEVFLKDVSRVAQFEHERDEARRQYDSACHTIGCIAQQALRLADGGHLPGDSFDFLLKLQGGLAAARTEIERLRRENAALIGLCIGQEFSDAGEPLSWVVDTHALFHEFPTRDEAVAFLRERAGAVNAGGREAKGEGE